MGFAGARVTLGATQAMTLQGGSAGTDISMTLAWIALFCADNVFNADKLHASSLAVHVHV